jgi:amidophosphoribosyltransferase
VIAHIAHHGFLAFADPHGLRPLVLGQRDTPAGPVYAFASESTCLDHLGFATLRDLQAGEAIFIDEGRVLHSRICHRARPTFCVFEYIYFAREDSRLHGKLVAGERVKMGKALARTFRQTGLQPDIVIDVPSSAYFFASGLAEELGVPYRRGFSKNRHIGRSFISPTQLLRERMVRAKLNPIREVVAGKQVAVVDDSIVRGTTSRHLVRLLREAGAAKVYFASASPPVISPCVYGIDMSIRREMIAASATVDEIRVQLGADALIYQRLQDLRALADGQGWCDACFSGEYPTSVTPQDLLAIEAERSHAKQEVPIR